MDRRKNTVDALLQAFGTSIRMRPAIPAALLALVLSWSIAVTVSSGQSSEPRSGGGDGTTAAIQRFWAVFHGNDYAAIPELQKDLEAALEWDPENVTLTALLGANHFWHVGEYRRDPSP
ncbi:MAG: hypothetical protein JOY95_02000, partial [Silvibacterium sp.]|nr:hypothetical protein [Silvibacterium sp.]